MLSVIHRRLAEAPPQIFEFSVSGQLLLTTSESRASSERAEARYAATTSWRRIFVRPPRRWRGC